MQKRTLKVALLAVLAIVLVLGISSDGPRGPDLERPARHGDRQVRHHRQPGRGDIRRLRQRSLETIPERSLAHSSPKWLWRLSSIPLMDPATASFTDVPKGSSTIRTSKARKPLV